MEKQIIKSFLPENQEIITLDGYKPIEDIKIGDYVYTISGEYKRVERIYKRNYTGDLIKIKINGYYNPITVIEDSIVLVYRKDKNKKRSINNISMVRARDLTLDDFVVYRLNDYMISEGSSIDFTNKYLARFLAYYVVYGFILEEKNKVAIHIDRLTDYHVYEIKECIYRILNTEMDRFEYEGENFLSVNDKKLMDMCEEFGTKNSNKFIPEYVISANEKFIKEFMNVFFELSKGDMYFRPSSQDKLLRGYQRLLMRFNSFANINECISKDKKFKYYSLTLNQLERDRFMKGEGSWFRDKDLAYLKIVDIEKISVDNKLVYGLVVNEPYYCNLMSIK